MPVFHGASWQLGHRQMGLGGLSRNLGKLAIPIVKRGAESLGKIALSSGEKVLGDVISGKKLKKAVKDRATEAVHTAPDKAITHTTGQSGRGKKRKRSVSKKRSMSMKGSSKKRKTTQ